MDIVEKIYVVNSWDIDDFNAKVAIDQRYNVVKNQLPFCAWIMNQVGVEHTQRFRDPYDGVYLRKSERAHFTLSIVSAFFDEIKEFLKEDVNTEEQLSQFLIGEQCIFDIIGNSAFLKAFRKRQKACDTFDGFPIIISEIQLDTDILFVYLETMEDSSSVLVSVIKSMLGESNGPVNLCEKYDLE